MIPRIRRIGPAAILASSLCVLWLAGCATQEANTADQAADEPAAEAAQPGANMPRVMFTNMENGKEYPTEYEVIFGVENFNIVPVEDPLVARPGEGHYHLAIDADCVAQGEIIPPGTPSYIHFGDGSDRITLQLTPGPHHLCLQVADGEHRVIRGPQHSNLTREIRITVAEQ